MNMDQFSKVNLQKRYESIAENVVIDFLFPKKTLSASGLAQICIRLFTAPHAVSIVKEAAKMMEIASPSDVQKLETCMEDLFDKRDDLFRELFTALLRAVADGKVQLFEDADIFCKAYLCNDSEHGMKVWYAASYLGTRYIKELETEEYSVPVRKLKCIAVRYTDHHLFEHACEYYAKYPNFLRHFLEEYALGSYVPYDKHKYPFNVLRDETKLKIEELQYTNPSEYYKIRLAAFFKNPSHKALSLLGYNGYFEGDCFNLVSFTSLDGSDCVIPEMVEGKRVNILPSFLKKNKKRRTAAELAATVL